MPRRSPPPEKRAGALTAGFGVSVRVMPQLDLTADTYATIQAGGGASSDQKISAEHGIPDKVDSCPNNPEDKDMDHDDDGCPEGSDGDRDGDGILDSRDKCPDKPEDKDGFEDTDGCPDPDNEEEGNKLCSFGLVKFRGSISDSLRGTSQPVLTEASEKALSSLT